MRHHKTLWVSKCCPVQITWKFGTQIVLATRSDPHFSLRLSANQFSSALSGHHMNSWLLSRCNLNTQLTIKAACSLRVHSAISLYVKPTSCIQWANWLLSYKSNVVAWRFDWRLALVQYNKTWLTDSIQDHICSTALQTTTKHSNAIKICYNRNCRLQFQQVNIWARQL